jgi:hypothetical protein
VNPVPKLEEEEEEEEEKELHFNNNIAKYSVFLRFFSHTVK